MNPEQVKPETGDFTSADVGERQRDVPPVESEYESVGFVTVPGGLRKIELAKYARAGGLSGKRICLAKKCVERGGSSWHLATFRIGDVDVCTAAAKKWAKQFPGTQSLASSLKAGR